MTGTSRRAVLAFAATSAASAGLSGCGFRLRGSQAFSFQRIAILPNPGGAVARELRSSFGAGVRVLAADDELKSTQLVLTLTDEQREKSVVGVNVSGQVREFQLRLRVRLSLRTAQGKAISVDDEIVQRRDISYNESAALAKEAEEVLLYRDMQTDIVQQILRRLAAVQPAQLD
ncbi:LPS assembly lipoprotein LptE [Rhodoferax sp.]|uniref:LPS-assembly lipoprotein LptE n=1 Tax=Rhodoferax sp. TaxID=50421 RepID=UPI002622D065|nr:LPS assembly lipoprotein LptE [Rhodoferax sp.]MDD2920423.1 LPS assembly lipoprotein LptE [Rhodoferax sp.]